MPHDIHQMMYVGQESWHGLGTPLPANGSYEGFVHAVGFYTAMKRHLYSPPMKGPIPARKSLFREDTDGHLATVSTGYEVVFADTSRLWLVA